MTVVVSFVKTRAMGSIDNLAIGEARGLASAGLFISRGERLTHRANARKD